VVTFIGREKSLLYHKGVKQMRCEYSDGTKVKYTGSLQITKGQEVNVFIKEALLTDDIRSDLDKALYKNSCGEIRNVAEKVTKLYGSKACIHELK